MVAHWVGNPSFTGSSLPSGLPVVILDKLFVISSHVAGDVYGHIYKIAMWLLFCRFVRFWDIFEPDVPVRVADIEDASFCRFSPGGGASLAVG